MVLKTFLQNLSNLRLNNRDSCNWKGKMGIFVLGPPQKHLEQISHKKNLHWSKGNKIGRIRIGTFGLLHAFEDNHEKIT